jgi:hypothetical protein
MYTGAAEMQHKRYNELVRLIERGALAESKQAPPNGETFSDPPVAMDLPSGKELPKSE